MKLNKEGKRKLVDELAKKMDKYRIIAVADMENIPALQLMRMRASLRGKVDIFMAKKRIIKRAIDNSKKENIDKLKEKVVGMPALIFTNENPFTLYKIIKKNKSKAPIKAGQKATSDIVVNAGTTDFAPGPIIGELGSVGIKSGIEGGKIVIKADTTVLKEGESCSAKLASILSRLGIEPVEIGLNITGVYEDGKILTKEILDINEEVYIQNIVLAYNHAKNLAYEISYPIKDIMSDLLFRGYSHALFLGVERAIVNTETIKKLLEKAYASTKSVLLALPLEALPEELRADIQSSNNKVVESTKNTNNTEEKKEEKKSPEEAAAGLGSLFG